MLGQWLLRGSVPGAWQGCRGSAQPQEHCSYSGWGEGWLTLGVLCYTQPRTNDSPQGLPVFGLGLRGHCCLTGGLLWAPE